jgi:hypothetical protein
VWAFPTTNISCFFLATRFSTALMWRSLRWNISSNFGMRFNRFMLANFTSSSCSSWPPCSALVFAHYWFTTSIWHVKIALHLVTNYLF